MSYDPAYINFDLNPYDEAAAAAELREDVDARFDEELSPLVAGGPVITRPPQDVTVPDGYGAIFTVTAIGTGTLAYRWQAMTGGSWSDTGDVGPAMSVTASAALNGAQYRCIVTDGSNRSTASLPATLTVT